MNRTGGGVETSYLAEVSARFADNRRAVAGLIMVLMMAATALLAPVIAPRDPSEQHLERRLTGPCREYPLGTDDLGRCLLSRLIHGGRTSLSVAVPVVLFTSLFGMIMGLAAGYAGKAVDEIIMRLVDVLLAFPGLILALIIVGLTGPGLFNTMIALGVVGWAGTARVVRGCAFSARERLFVTAARTMGAGHLHIVLRHILPEVISPVIVLATMGMGGTILSAAALSFLGFGIRPPTPEWGAMLSCGKPFLRTAPHIITFPGIAIMFTVLAFNFLGDGLRDALDPWHTARSER